jgi:sirohydrochlorin cobaltochelatase
VKQITEKKAILLVAFGTSVEEAHSAYDNIEHRVKTAFPELEIRWGFTSSLVRRKLEAKGREVYSPASALTRLADEGFTHIIAQSLHIIPGLEYHDLLRISHSIQGLPKGLQQIKVSGPLLENHTDYTNVAQIIHDYSQTFVNEGEALLLMGHGTPHSANICYPGLQYYFRMIDSSIYVGTIEGFPSIEDIVPQLKQNGLKRLWLMPLLTSAGDHVLKDMSGEQPKSWKSILINEGFEVMIHPISLGMMDAIVDLWIAKIRHNLQ